MRPAAPFHSQSVPESLRKSPRLTSVTFMQVSEHSSWWVKAHSEALLLACSRPKGQTVRERCVSDLLAAEFPEVCTSECWGCRLHKVVGHFLLSWSEGRVTV